MATLRQGIYQLLAAVEIDTKEEGRTHVTPWMSQRIVIDAVAKGLSEDVHEFVILKSRQMAVTTVCSVIELFWCLANPGVQGAIIADRGDNLERLRRIFASLLETLPPEWRGPEHQILVNNRNGMAFANRSVIDLLAAGNNPDLGASRAVNLLHATECSLWRSLSGVESLKASLARQNPNRLYLWETIANGFNWLHGHWEQAKVDRHMRAIFIGFWANPTYSIAKSDPDFATYMPKNRDGTYDFTPNEIERARYVKQEYGVVIKPEQICWWRREAEFKDEQYMFRHYPWHEREAFISSGQGFFPAARTLEISEQLAAGAPYKGYKYIFQEEGFLSSRIEQTTNKDEVTLRVWEPPQPDGVYVLGIDPSGGGGGDANDHAIEVFRCYADRLVQVAEYQTNVPLTYQLAWVLAHLCGAYKNHLANLEITGIGASVLPELRNMRMLAERRILQADPAAGQILDMIGSVRWFLYQRPDTYGGAGNVHSWKTNHDNKAMIFSELRNGLMKTPASGGEIEIRSLPLIKQIQATIEDQGWIGAGPDTGENDDLVMAAALAAHAWTKWKRDGLVAQNLTWNSVNGPRLPSNPEMVMSWIVSEHWSAIQAKRRERREKF